MTLSADNDKSYCIAYMNENVVIFCFHMKYEQIRGSLGGK